MNKKFISLVVAVCVSSFLTIVSSCTSDKRTPLIVYSPHGKDMLEFCTKEFEATHPEIVVQWLDMGSQDCLDRIRSEHANPQADCWWGAPASLFTAAENEALLAAYAPSWKSATVAETHSAKDFWYGTFLTPEVIAINSTVVALDTAPHDWNDLLQPRWKGKIVIREPLASGTMRTIFCSLVQREEKRTGSIDSGFAWLKALDANTESYCADQTQLYLKLSRGEASVTVWNMPDIMLQSQVHHYPFAPILPSSGTPILVDCIALVAGAKHDAAAKAFYEFVTSKEQMIAQANQFFRIPARTDIPADSIPKWMQGLPQMHVDWTNLAAHEKEWMQRWSDQIKSNK